MRTIVLFGFAIVALVVAGAAQGQQAADNSTADAKAAAIAAEQKAAFAAAEKAAVNGPSDVPLAGQGTLHLPDGYLFVPREEAARVMRAMGNSVGANFIGAIFPGGQGNWFATLSFVKAGYVKDEEAKDWDADALLKSLREGTEEGNGDRKARGFPEIEVRGWVEKPTYDAATHRLLWSALVVGKGEQTSDGSVNYNTYALGREGYFSLDLIASASAIAAEKRHAQRLLEALAYDQGKTYGDFNASTDRIAEYGIAALIAGVAAKKLGLLALIGVFLVKFAKVILVGVGAAAYAFTKFFRRKPKGGPVA